MKPGFSTYIDQPWAIDPDFLKEKISAIEAADVSSYLDASKEKEYGFSVRDGIAVIPVEGGLTKKTEYFGWFFGFGTSYEQIRNMISTALEAPDVDAILLDIDSPGGVVNGCQELAAYIRSADAQKPVYAYANGLMASAACWIGAAAREVAAPASAQVGSIGVVTTHVDISKAEEKRGVKRTYLTAGKYKAVGNPSQPLTKEDTDYFLERLNAIYKLFVDDVAEFRGIKVAAVEDWADGKVLMASEAQKHGLIDRSGVSFEHFISHIKQQGGSPMDLERLKAEHPELVAQIQADAVKAFESKMTMDAEAAVSAAEASCLTIVAAVAGEEIHDKVKTFMEAKFSGAQLKVMEKMGVGEKPAAVAPTRAEILAGIKEAIPEPAAGVTGKSGEGEPLDFEALVKSRMAKTGEDKGTAIFELAAIYPEAHESWLKDQQA